MEPNSVGVWDQMAEKYAERFLNIGIYNRSYQRFIEPWANRRHLRFLDIGCGPAIIASAIHRSKPEWKGTGIDSSKAMIDSACKRFPGIHFAVLDARLLHLLNGTFDLLFGGFIIPYLDEGELAQFFKNCYHKLPKSGALYVSFVGGDPQHSGYLDGPSGLRLFFRYYHPEYIVHLAEGLGFKKAGEEEVLYQSSTDEEQMHTIYFFHKYEI